MIQRLDIEKAIYDWVSSNGYEQPLLIITHSKKLQEELCTFAKRSAVCEARQNGPCGICNACKQSDANTHPDTMNIVGEKNRIRVKDIFAIRSTLATTSKKRVVCIPFAEHLLPQAANALLKTLEEHSATTRFLLGAKSIRSVLPTIRSRCKIISVNALLQQEAPFSVPEMLNTLSDLRVPEAFQEHELLEISRLIHHISIEQGVSPELFKVSLRLRDYYKASSIPGGNTKLAADILLASLAVLRNTNK